MKNKLELLESRLNQAFESFYKVFKIELSKKFYIVENEKTGTAYIELINKLEKVFTIENNSFQVGFIPIDGKLGLLGFGNSYCDFIVFNDKNFCFIELKLNAVSLEERAISKNRKKGIQQLENTIDLFDQKLNKNYEQLNLEAYISTPLIYPRLNASWQEIALNFLESKGIPLYEKNEKVFA